MKSHVLDYKIEGETFQGYVAYDERKKGERPVVLIAHDWTGLNDYAKQKAEALSELGYVGFAIDMYGEGRSGSTNEEKMQLMQPLMENRQLLSQRVNGAFNAILEQPEVNPLKSAIIGYCFGGLCALDLARSGANVGGAVSFHGLLSAPSQKQCIKIKSKVLVLNGYDDSMVTPKEVNDFISEMNDANVDWQLHHYGHTLHAFTNPLANDYDLGTVYNKVADKRSWVTCKNFLAEVFA